METIQTPGLFGNETRTSVLLAIAMLGETQAAEIAKALGRGRSRVKDAVDGLERAGVLQGTLRGRTRVLSLSPRYVAAQELKALLDRLALHDLTLQDRLATLRRRPRRAGKAL